MKKNILFLDTTAGVGGAIRSLTVLIGSIRKDVYNLHVIYSGKPGYQILQRYADRVKFKRIVYPKISRDSLFVKKLNKWAVLLGPFSTFAVKGIIRITLILLRSFYCLRIYHYSLRNKIDLIHFNSGIENNWWGVIVAKIKGVPCVCHQRGILSEYHMRGTHFIASLVDRYIAVSWATKEDMVRFGLPGERICVVHNAIDTQYASKISVPKSPCLCNDEAFNVVMVGTLQKWKGQDVFIQAAKQVVERYPKARFYMVGSVPKGDRKEYEDELKELISNLRLEGKAILTGQRSDMLAIQSHANVIVHASVEPEPFGRVIIEGMMLGKPVIASNLGGPCEIIEDKVDGFLINPGDPEDMANKIIKILKNPRMAQMLGERARKKVLKHFVPRIHTKKIESIYNSCLSKN